MFIRCLFVAAFFFSFFGTDVKAQDTILFPGITGNALRDSLVVHYKPPTVLSYDNARHTLYGQIYNADGYVECVYTGDVIFVDPESPVPATYAWNEYNWSTEHIYPQSKGAGGGNARADMHHLQPIRQDVNASRANYPFTYLEDEEVRYWWRQDVKQESVPENYPGEWSKTKTSEPRCFEVRDETKGNVARSMFYFFTMYRDEAFSMDNKYMQLQIEDLRSYHNDDPVDSLEVARSFAKAEFQNDMVNPFVIDTTLVRRLYGIEIPRSITVTSASESQINIQWERNRDGDKVMIVWNQTGNFGSPVDGVVYAHGEAALNGTVVIAGDTGTFHHAGLSDGTYYYKFVSVHGEENERRYSTGVFESASTGDPLLLQYWNFNNPPGDTWGFEPVHADHGDGVLTHTFETAPQTFSGSTLNAYNDDPAGASFVPQGGSGTVNNNKYIELHVPTTGYKNTILAYAAMGTSTGFSTHRISYSLDGTFGDEIVHEEFTSISSSFTLYMVSFAGVDGSENNPDFSVRIMLDGATGVQGNNRIDNITVTGNPVPVSEVRVDGGSYQKEPGEETSTHIPFFFLRLSAGDTPTVLRSVSMRLNSSDTGPIHAITLWESLNERFDTEAEPAGFSDAADADDIIIFDDLAVDVNNTDAYIYVTVEFADGYPGDVSVNGEIRSFEDMQFTSAVVSCTDNVFPVTGSSIVVSAPAARSMPYTTKLYQSYPNPANPGAHITFTLQENGYARIHLYSVLGQRVTTITEEVYEAGIMHSVRFDGSALPSGVYYYVLETASKQLTRPLLLIK